jgi:hypothetical protein
MTALTDVDGGDLAVEQWQEESESLQRVWDRYRFSGWADADWRFQRDAEAAGEVQLRVASTNAYLDERMADELFGERSRLERILGSHAERYRWVGAATQVISLSP